MKPWGLSIGALLGLVLFWLDKATNVKLLLGLAVDGTPVILLTTLLVVPYVVQGYISLYWLTSIEPVKPLLSKCCTSELGNVFLVPLLPIGTLLTVALGVALFNLTWALHTYHRSTCKCCKVPNICGHGKSLVWYAAYISALVNCAYTACQNS